ncbi:MAG: hypothetical protein GY835_17570 [bacterium]|nr:hypothetical protein [bacterium]
MSALLIILTMIGFVSGARAETEPIVATCETHVVIYGRHLDHLDQDLLENIDYIILDEEGLPLLEPRFHSRALLYFDMWGKGGYSYRPGGVRRWQPGPGDIGQPRALMNGRTHCYRFDDAHVELFLGWIEDYLKVWGERVPGIFLDDFASERWWWESTPEVKDLVWGPWDDRDGWRENRSGWNVRRVRAIETGAVALVRRYCGEGSFVVVNGTAPTLDGVRRFAEDVGAPRSERWDRLETPGVDEVRYIKRGDFLQVNGVGPTGIWGDWTDTPAGNGFANLKRACALATERGCSVGLSYGVRPRRGGTTYQYLADPLDPLAAWPFPAPADR